ncbi:MAG: glycosyltransferase family 2 protein [Candidatus Scalindua sp.]|nr:glycosyltransferase family 2 protein [Candidatus Scalindua sp.]
MDNGETSLTIPRSFIIPVLDYSPHSPYNIRTLLDDLEHIEGEVVCIFNSKEIFDDLNTHPRINKYCYNSLNSGVSRSWNAGINLSEGKTLFILNSDVHLLHSAIEQLESYLFSLDKAVIAGPQGAHIDYRTLSDQRYFRKRTFFKPVQVHAVSGFFFAIHHQRFLEHCLMFDVQFSPCFFEEWDMGLQIALAGLACYAVPVEGFEHHWGASQDGNLSVNYFGREMTRSDILSKGRERFKAKWHDAIFSNKQEQTLV